MFKTSQYLLDEKSSVFKFLITFFSNTLELFVDACFIFLFLCFGIVGMQYYYNYKYDSMMRLVFTWLCRLLAQITYFIISQNNLDLSELVSQNPYFQSFSLTNLVTQSHPVSCRMLIWGSYLVQFTQTKPKSMLCVLFWVLRFSFAKPK